VNAAKHLEATLNDGFIASGDVPARTQLVTQCYFNAGIQANKTDKATGAQYLDKAIQYGGKAIDAGGAQDQTYQMVVNAAYVKEDYKTAAKYEQQAVDSQVQKGQTPSADQLDMLRSAYFKLNDNKGLFNAFKTTLAYHPTPDLWEQAISVIAIDASKQPASELQLYRLMLEAKVLKKSNEFSEFADTANRQGSPGEAKSVLEKGFAANVFNEPVKTDMKKLQQTVTTKSQSDQASLPGLVKEAQAAPNGQKLNAVGFAYFGYEQYDKAADMLTQALAKGGLQNEADTRLLLGISQLKGGHADEANKTFAQVKGNDSLEQLAQLWPLTTKGGT